MEIQITDSKKNYGDKQTLKGMIRVFSRSLTVRQTHIEKRFYNKCWGQVMSLTPKL